jgi:hypothetical protein
MKTIPSMLREESGARGISGWHRQDCTGCGQTDALYRLGRCISCGTSVPTGPLWEQEHSIRGRRKS